MNALLNGNLLRVRENIKLTAEKIRRSSKDPIQLIVVTKTISVPIIRQLKEYGVRDIGENKVQEAKQKIQTINTPYHWHMIGHLQTNKVKAALEIFQTIHSVDSVRLAQAISKEAVLRGRIFDVFCEINVSSEESKYGFSPSALKKNIDMIQELSGIRIKGLMTMAPLTDDQSMIRRVFSSLRHFKDELDPGWQLSMGMSQDYAIAVEEGADIVRIGSAIFKGVC